MVSTRSIRMERSEMRRNIDTIIALTAVLMLLAGVASSDDIAEITISGKVSKKVSLVVDGPTVGFADMLPGDGAEDAVYLLDSGSVTVKSNCDVQLGVREISTVGNPIDGKMWDGTNSLEQVLKVSADSGVNFHDVGGSTGYTLMGSPQKYPGGLTENTVYSQKILWGDVASDSYTIVIEFKVVSTLE
jgi:hypothetical protein